MRMYIHVHSGRATDNYAIPSRFKREEPMKHPRRAVHGTIICLMVAFLLDSSEGAPLSCGELGESKLPDTTISYANYFAVGGKIGACRVIGAIHPTRDSDIAFEVWLPFGGWNGKYLAVGELGAAGAINQPGILEAVRRGYAASSTDTGHVGAKSDYAPGHPEKVIDSGWRARHLEAERSKQLIRLFYDKPAKHSYTNSCSHGGLQALMEAQRFPEDFDGMIVGAPVHDLTHLMVAAVWNEQALWKVPGAYLSASKRSALQAATLASCDALDGVKDGVVEDPRRCHFDPSSLACPEGTDGDGCLTPPQLNAVRMIMQGPRNPRNGKQIYPGLFTSASGDSDWGFFLAGSATPGTSWSSRIATAFLSRKVDELPPPGRRDLMKFDFDRDVAAVDAKLEHVLNATDPNLQSFRKANPTGRIIIWHGWEDPAAPALRTVDYYREVVSTNASADDFVRLFMVPGMVHCSGGRGPESFGQMLPQETPLSHSPEHDVLSALEHWVEDGAPPERIIAVKYVDDDPTKGIVRTRPLCRYPMTAVYKGTGSTDEAANFECRTPQTD